MPATSNWSRKKSRTGSSSRKNAKRLRISIIGAGRLGTALGRALRRAGHRLDVVITARNATARRAAKAIDSGSLAVTWRQLRDPHSVPLRRLSASDLIIIATPDATIASVVSELTAVLGKKTARSTRKSQTLLHTSGAISSQILKPLSLAGIATGSLHPLVSVADVKSHPEIFRDIYFCVEGDARAIRLARMIVAQLGGRSFTVKSESKPVYHAAAVMTSGHVVALFDLALLMLRKCGLSSRQAKRVLLPLLKSTTTNLERNSAERALTGPYARSDFETARKHLIALDNPGLEDANQVYKILARHSVHLGKTLKHNREIERLARLLDSIS
jgi:predicted short-subunit dehydrogenase-like oxidoreductase (DUF2520 family)